MKTLVIGGTGFLGSRIVELLAGAGHEVAVLHREATKCVPGEGGLHIHGDRNELAELSDDIREFAPEVVLDVIPYTEAQAEQLLHSLRGVAQRLVVLSSADVYRNYDGFRGEGDMPPDPCPLPEDAPLRESRFPYRGSGVPFEWADDYDKILVERAVSAMSDLPATVLRLPAVYGPGDRQHRLRAYLRPMDDGRPVVLLSERQADWRWTRGYVENVAAAVARAVVDDRAAGRVYNVGEERAPTEREWVDEIAAAAEWDGDVVTVPRERLPEHLCQPFDFRFRLATDTRRIRTDLGFTEPVGRREALRRTVAWERTHPQPPDTPDYAAEDAVLAALGR